MSARTKASLPYLFNEISKDVTNRTFPQPENWFGMSDDQYEELTKLTFANKHNKNQLLIL